LAASGSAAAAKGVVNIAVVADETGSFAPANGTGAILAYFDQVNANGGVNGYKIVPTVYDAGSAPATAEQAVRRAIAARPAAIVAASIGIGSALGTLAQSGIPVVGDGFVPGWTGQPNLFSVLGDASGHNSDVWVQALKSVGATKIAMLTSPVEIGDAKLWTKLAPSVGVSVVMSDYSVPTVPSSAAALSIAQQIKASGANGVLIVGLFGGEAQFQADLNQLGTHITVLETGEFGPEVLSTYGSSVNGMLFAEAWASQYTTNNSGIASFVSDMQKYGYSSQTYAAFAVPHYAEAKLLVEKGLAAVGAPFSASALIKALGSVQDYTADGLLQKTSYPEFQQIGTNCLAVTRVVDGKWVAEINSSYPFICGGPSVPVPAS
jgi:branched-chain amino acid transport system substrate-binding protein